MLGRRFRQYWILLWIRCGYSLRTWGLGLLNLEFGCGRLSILWIRLRFEVVG